jgi:hypothetical protein
MNNMLIGSINYYSIPLMKKEALKKDIDVVRDKVVRPFVDFVLGRTMSKKLTVFIVATVALWQDLISGTEWSVFAGIYVFGLLWLNHLQEMAKARQQVQDFRGADNIDINPEEKDY